MAKIKEIIFPGKLGKANGILVRTGLFDLTQTTVWINYDIVYNDENISNKILSSGRLLMDEETYNNWGFDNGYVVNWVVTQLGLELA